MKINTNFIDTSHIINAIQNKEERGLSILYDRYSSSLLGIINNIIEDSRISEEILQQTMLKIWNNIDKFEKDKGNFFTWMAAIARNTAIDKTRLKGFQRNQKTKDLDSTVITHEVSHTNAFGVDVERLFKKLDNKYKDVLDYLYLKGFTQKEAAEALDIPLGTVKTRLRSAVSILREELKSEKKLFLGMLFLVLILLLLWI
jgi:RNA polymerase sigma-70 factor (ECF subfamily)